MNRHAISLKIIRKYRGKKYLLRLMAVMACLALAMALVSTLILTALRNDRMNRERAVQELILDSAVEGFEKKIYSSYQAIYSILGNQEIMETLTSYQRVINSYSEDQKIQNVISSLYFVYQSNSDIKDVMILQKQKEYVASYKGITSAESYYKYSFKGDDAIWQAMQGSRINMKFFVCEESQSLYILHSVYHKNKDFGTLELELDLSDYYVSEKMPGNTNERIICLTDREGGLVGYLSNSRGDGLVAAAVAEGEVPGYLMLMREISSEKLYLLALTPTKAITHEISMLFGVCIGIIGVTLLAGLTISVKVCQQIMEPLYQAVGLIETAGKVGGQNELETITRNFNTILKDRDQMSAIVERTTPTVLETIFRRLIMGVSSESDYREMLDVLTIEMRQGEYMAVIIRSDPERSAEETDWDIGASVSEGRIREIFGNTILLGFRYRRAEYVLIVNLQNGASREEIPGRASELARETGLIIGMGRIVQEILRIGDSYQSAKEAISARPANREGGGVFDANQSIRRTGYELPPDMESLIYRYMVAGNTEWACRTIRQALSQNLDNGVSYCDYMELLVCLESYLIRLHEHLDASLRQRVSLESASPREADNVHRRTEILMRNCEALCSLYENSQEDETMNRIIAYIDENLSRDIGLDEVAELAGLTPNYLTKYFKMKRGVNFKAFLTEKRIERAKELLENTDCSVRDIAEMCGYNSSKQLILNFTKLTGITPGEYKKAPAAGEEGTPE